MKELKLIYKGLLRKYNNSKKDIKEYLEVSIVKEKISI